MKIPNINKLSKASQLSLLAIVILLGAVFFTVTSALQTQNSASHASGAIVYQSGGYTCYYIGLTFQCSSPTPIIRSPQPTTPIYRAPTATPTPTKQTTCIIRPTCRAGEACPQYIGVGYCNPTPTPVRAATPTPTLKPTPTPTLNPTPTPTGMPVATIVPTATPTPAPTTAVVPTAIPGDTVLNLVVGLHGIGTAGDSAAPGTDGNMNPLHPTRTVTVTVFNSQNQQAASQQGSVTYNSTSGRFIGSVDLGSQFATGLYTVKIQTAQYLRGLVPGIQTITSGQSTTLPYIALVAGDINGDNQINILDYNILMGCYSDLLPAVSCTAANNVLSDLNDDGNVNEFDYNLFLRELSNVSGN